MSTVAICFVPGVAAVIRRYLWRKINPHIEELSYGSKSSVFRSADYPGKVLKAHLYYCASDPNDLRHFVENTIRPRYELAKDYVGEWLHPTEHDVINIGTSNRPVWSASAIQSYLSAPGVSFALESATFPRNDPGATESLRDLCRATLQLHKDTGVLMDVFGYNNLLMSKPISGRARLILVDTGPCMPVAPDAHPQIHRLQELNIKRLRWFAELDR